MYISIPCKGKYSFSFVIIYVHNNTMETYVIGHRIQRENVQIATITNETYLW